MIMFSALMYILSFMEKVFDIVDYSCPRPVHMFSVQQGNASSIIPDGNKSLSCIVGKGIFSQPTVRTAWYEHQQIQTENVEVKLS